MMLGKIKKSWNFIKNNYKFVITLFVISLFLIACFFYADVTSINVVVLGFLYNVIYIKLFHQPKNKRRKLLLKRYDKICNTKKISFNEPLFDMNCDLEQDICTCLIYIFIVLPVITWDILKKYFLHDYFEEIDGDYKFIWYIAISIVFLFAFFEIIEKNETRRIFNQITDERKKDDFFKNYKNGNIYDGDEIYLKDFEPKEYELMKFSENKVK